MQHLKFFSIVIFLAGIFFACSSNNSTVANKVSKDFLQSTPAKGGSGNDMFYEYKLTSSGKDISIQSNTKIYISSKGDMRVEMNVMNSAIPGQNSGPIVIIGHSDKPNESISIDDSAKTYTINQFSDSDFNTGEKMKTISVSKVGEEKILEYNSVHARVITEKSIGNFYSSVDTFDIWRSNDVPLLPSIKDLFDRFESKTGNAMYPVEVAGQLKQMGCDGFMTKMEIHSKNSSTTEELVKVDHQNLPAGMFQIPAGYTEDKEGM